MEKNGILLLESENRSLKDAAANKQRFTENFLNLDESNILSHIKKINTGSNNTILEKKDKQRCREAEKQRCTAL